MTALSKDSHLNPAADSSADAVQGRRRFFGKAATAAVAAPLAGFPMISVAQSPVVMKMQGAWGPNEIFTDMAKQLALGPGASSPEELLAQKSLAHPDRTLGELKDDLFNRMREVFELSRIRRIDAPCGGYAHHDGSKACLVELAGKAGSAIADVAKDIAMHIVAMAPKAVSKEELDPAAVEKEKEILTEAALAEGKPANIVEKMIEGRLRNFFSQCVLLEQPFVKDDKQTVGKLAQSSGIEVKTMENWSLGG